MIDPVCCKQSAPRSPATIAGDSLGVQQPGIDVLPERAEVADVAEPPADTEIAGVVLDGLGVRHFPRSGDPGQGYHERRLKRSSRMSRPYSAG